MKPAKGIQQLKLGIVVLDPPVSIESFDNHSGKVEEARLGTGLKDGIIQSEDGRTVWAGTVHLNEDRTFDLCVTPIGANAEEIFR
jgi:hypothetical protein